jgi:hypothetical protein
VECALCDLPLRLDKILLSRNGINAIIDFERPLDARDDNMGIIRLMTI